MPITHFHATPPSRSVAEQVLELVKDNITDLSKLSIPPSNPLYEVYAWALPVEVGVYMSRIGEVPSEPVELFVAFDDADPRKVTGFVLFSPVPHSDACGVNYMAVSRSDRRRGIGSDLMKMVVDRYPHVELTCTVKTVPFYESLGFQVLDVHNTQVVMNTRSESSTGMMAVLNVAAIYESGDARAIHSRLVQRWGGREMRQAEKQLERHVAQLERQARAFVDARLNA